MMFQSYALFPHMNVAKNVGFGLRRDGVAGRDRARASPRRWTWCGWPTTASASRPNCRAASASAWRWPARSSSGPSCCCSTSRWRRSTASCARSTQLRAGAPAGRARHHLRHGDPRPGRGDDHGEPASPSWTRAASCRSARRTRSTSTRAHASSPTSSASPTSCRSTGGRAWLALRPEKIALFVSPAQHRPRRAGPHRRRRLRGRPLALPRRPFRRQHAAGLDRQRRPRTARALAARRGGVAGLGGRCRAEAR